MSDIDFVSATDAQWNEFIKLAKRSYGHEIRDAELLRDVADKRVADHDGAVIGGGVGLHVNQFFGGRAVSSGLLADGCIAPEARGSRLAVDLVKARTEALRERGAVISSIWTSSNEYGRRMGWEASCHVFSWRVRADDLRRAFAPQGYFAHLGLTKSAEALRRTLSRDWNGAIERPPWWSEWKRRKSDLVEYRFEDEESDTGGLLALTMKRDAVYGMQCEVHDFVAANDAAAASMFAFLSRLNSRAEFIDFRRGCLGPNPYFLHNLHRFRAEAKSWHPWMLRILDLPGAVAQRGWPDPITTGLVVEVSDGLNGAGRQERYRIEVTGGPGIATITKTPPDVVLNRCQLACWYAGGYRSEATALHSGISFSSPGAASTFLAMTATHEPWLADHF